MSTNATTTTTDNNNNRIFSFVTHKQSRQTAVLLETTTTTTTTSTASSGITLDILQTGLSANNKFYLDFGDKPPFNFFQCYPVHVDQARLVQVDEKKKKETMEDLTEYVHPPVWGICRVSHIADGIIIPGVSVGDTYLAQLPMADQVTFESAHVDEQDSSLLIIHRPTTPVAYNTFTKVNPNDTLLHPDYGTLALVCFPGIITGFALYFDLKQKEYYGCQTIVIASASSKVALALAFYLKQQQQQPQQQTDDDDNKNNKIKVIGYTSEANKAFCESTNLYDTILGYDDKLSNVLLVDKKEEPVVMIDISGNGKVYSNNVMSSNIVKLLCIGNSSGTPDANSTFATFSVYAKLKMILTMMGILPNIMRSWMNPTQELFLAMNTIATLKQEWGLEQYQKTVEEYTRTFCEQASKWITTIRNCVTEESIQTAFAEIVKGTVPPSEAIGINVAKAVAHRKTK